MSINSISPLDGRYQEQTSEIAAYFSEAALIRFRVQVEVEWLIALAQNDNLPEVRRFDHKEITLLRALVRRFTQENALRVKEIEKTTRHDVKAVEYWIKEQLEGTSLAKVSEWVHFACTSEDINNLAYALMLKGGLENVWRPAAEKLQARVFQMAEELKNVPMLSRTHGQPASPSTLGKELAVFAWRWKRQLEQNERLEFLGKINGAVGNFNAHVAAYPAANWPQIAQNFVESLGLTYNPLTTQIESHDWIAELCHNVARFNSILVDFDRDVWSYISLNYFKQQVVAGAVGSSTMPHKVNPINFENSEANAEISNAQLLHLAGKLPISRLQRDLTDSSTLRNLGTALGHSLLSIRSCLRGLDALSVNRDVLARDLNEAWEVLAEPVQTVMRKQGHENPYEKLKELTRGAGISRHVMAEFIRGLDLPASERERLLQMTPANYVGLAEQLIEPAQIKRSDSEEN